MDFQEALHSIDRTVFSQEGRHLTEPEVTVLNGAWQHQTYQEMAESSPYSENYLMRDIGPKLWKLFSKLLEEEVSKSNFKSVIERQLQSQFSIINAYSVTQLEKLKQNQCYEKDQLYGTFKEKCNTLISLSQDLRKQLQSLNIHALDNTLSDLEQYILKTSFKVLVFGEFKSGKSSLINALLGQEVLPVSIHPCTGIITEIKWDTSPRALLHLKSSTDGSVNQKEIDIDQLAEHIVIKDDTTEIHENFDKKIELFLPLELCYNGVEIIDSPGLGGYGVLEKITTDYLANVDAILFVFSCMTPLSASETSFIENYLMSAGYKDIFFICNHFDKVDSEQSITLKEYVTSKLWHHTNLERKGIFFISSSLAREGCQSGDTELVYQSGIPLLKSHLEEFLAVRKGKMRILQFAQELKNLTWEAQKISYERRMSLQSDYKTWKGRYIEAKESLKQLEEEREYIIRQIESFQDIIRDLVKQRVRHFFRNVIEKITEWTEKYKIQEPIKLFSEDIFQLHIAIGRVVSELSNYLTTKIEEEFTTWQCERLQPLLEKELEHIVHRLDEDVSHYLSNADKLRLQFSGTSELILVDRNKTENPSLNRILASVSSYLFVNSVSTGIEDYSIYQEVSKPLINTLAIVMVSFFMVRTIAIVNPLLLVPIILYNFINSGLATKEKVNERIKKEVGKKYIETIEELSKKQADDEIAKTIVNKLNEIKDYIRQELDKELQIVKNQMESMYLEKQEGQDKLEETDEKLHSIFKALEKIDSQLSFLIEEVKLSG